MSIDMSKAPPGDPKVSDTYKTICRRLRMLNPPIELEKYVWKDQLIAEKTTLDGLTFCATDPEALKRDLRKCVTESGEPVFAVGSKEDSSHWALKLSFKRTVGTGFREIWRPKLSSRPLSMADARPGRFGPPRWDKSFGANAGASMERQDITSLHCAISADACNIHIDETGFVMGLPGSQLVVNPDFLQHLLLELYFKTDLKDHIPFWLLDRFNLEIPNSQNNYSGLSLSFDAIKNKNVKLTVMGSCKLIGGFECAGTVTLRGSHDIGGGRR